ncbi:hypothetical protein ACFCYM_13880 [Streptomyces sp. NPDC056254]|uniref:hypothetical protein n=1 Tax=Streptomyces sp. NPDC056254 TaxID=3345763 RepID=UPI0035DBB180
MDALFEVCERGGARAGGHGVEPVKLRHGLSLVLVGHGDLAEVVVSMKVDVAADAADVRTYGDGVVAVVGAKMDVQAACGDVVVDVLGIGAHLPGLFRGAPRHGVVGPGPLGVDLLLECPNDAHGDAVPGQLVGCPVGVVGLLPVYSGKDHRVRAGVAEAEVL